MCHENSSKRKEDVIAELLMGVLHSIHLEDRNGEDESAHHHQKEEGSGDEGAIVYLEKAQREHEYFLHIVFSSPREVEPLHCTFPRRTILVDTTISHQHVLPISTAALHVDKKPKKWPSFKTPKPTPSTPTIVTSHCHHQVWNVECSHDIEELQSNVLPHMEVLDMRRQTCVPAGSSGLLYFSHFIQEHAREEAICKSVCAALYFVVTHFKHKHRKRGVDLKEKIYNEVVTTMIIPLVVLEYIGDRKDDFDVTKFMCTFANGAFYQLTRESSVRTPLTPPDMKYGPNVNGSFHALLSHPQIHARISELMDQRNSPTPNCSSEGERARDSESLSRSPSSEISIAKSSSELGRLTCKNFITLIGYGDDVLPISDYEIHIYKVNGTRIGMVINDISEKVKHLQLIEQASRAKTEFLANVNHEFRTPLNSIDGNLQLLMRTSPLTDRQRDLIHRMRLSGTALMSLLQEVLDYAKLEQKHLRLHNETFSIRHCIQSTLNVMSSAVQQKHNKIEYHFDLDVPTLIMGDSFRLQQILVNLISNANNFTERGAILIAISISQSGSQEKDSSSSEQFISFSVTDNGLGVSEDVRNNLFMPWTQSAMNKTQLSSIKGTGLGLAICKELVTLMGGKIELVKTAPNQGSTFRFDIPLRSAEDAITIGESAKQEVATLKGKTILLLFPDGYKKTHITKALLSWGVKPTICSSHEEVMDYINAANANKSDVNVSNGGVHTYDLYVLATLTCPCIGPEDSVSTEEDGEGKSIISLASWITKQNPHTPLVAIGTVESASDPSCVAWFRKILPDPVNVDQLFHVLVNLFSDEQNLPSSSISTTTISKMKSEADSKLRRLKILVVEDVRENQEVLVEMLQLLGVESIQCASNGKEMLQILSSEDVTEFDVVLLDLLMPVMNGLDAAKAYRAQNNKPLGSSPLLVAVTATSLVEDDPESYNAAGMDAFIGKPIKFHELKTLLILVAEQSK